MKAFAILFCVLFSYQSSINLQADELVRVKIKGEEAYEKILMRDLIGTWKNVAGVTPILSQQTLNGTLSIERGNLVRVSDEWALDLPNKLNDLQWRLQDEELLFKSPSMGTLDMTIEKLRDSNLLEITLNSYTYRKAILKSGGKRKS
jgi:hypothetical protein